MKLTKAICPPCPNCQTTMTARDDKYECPACKSWYYKLSFPKYSQGGAK